MSNASPVPLLEVSRLSKRFGRIHAVRAASFRLGAAETVALVGGDGSGKTTLAKLIAGVYAPDGGELRYFGRARRYASAAEASAAGIDIICQDKALADHSAVAARRTNAHSAHRIVILDEPAAALAQEARARLTALVRDLTSQGAGVILVSHDLNDIFAVADRIVVLRHGAVVGERRADATDPDEVARLIDG